MDRRWLMNKKNNKKTWVVIIFIIALIMIITSRGEKNEETKKSGTFKIISSTSTSKMDNELIKYGKKNGIKVEIEHYGDLEIVDILNSNAKDYDAVWISNSIWLYMLDNSNLTTDSKSIVIDPVVMAIQKSKAEELGFTNKDVYNKDILEAIKEGKLKYVMSSVTQTNTGATTYLSFLNSLAGSPEILTSEMLKNEKLQKDLTDFFKGVERVSGNEDYLTEMYLKGDYNAMINYESSLIEINKKLIEEGKEQLYLIYPVDGVAINDMPFAYINNDSKDIAIERQQRGPALRLAAKQEVCVGKQMKEGAVGIVPHHHWLTEGQGSMVDVQVDVRQAFAVHVLMGRIRGNHRHISRPVGKLQPAEHQLSGRAGAVDQLPGSVLVSGHVSDEQMPSGKHNVVHAATPRSFFLDIVPK